MGGKPVPIPVEKPRDKILCIADLQKAGSAKMQPAIREFINSGATDQITVTENTTAYAKYRVRSRVLIDVADADTTTTCFGRKVSMPLGTAPAGVQGLAHPEGEKATSRAAARAGVNQAISSFSSFTITDIREAGRSVPQGSEGIAHAIQIYTFKNLALEERILREAEQQGCSAVFLTADSPVLGVRYNEWRNDFRVSSHVEFGFPVVEWDSERIKRQSHDDMAQELNDDRHSWAREIPWLRSVTKMEIWIKGVVTAEDTIRAVEAGCDGIIVSNHGGRQLDGVPATIDALPECVAAAAGRIRVHVDGGIRSGTDLFKAIALGAEYCWIGRPVYWGLAYDGEEGVKAMLDIYRNEFKRCMQLCGCNTVRDITPACLSIFARDGRLARL